jgi:hypothetical protein
MQTMAATMDRRQWLVRTGGLVGATGSIAAQTRAAAARGARTSDGSLGVELNSRMKRLERSSPWDAVLSRQAR